MKQQESYTIKWSSKKVTKSNEVPRKLHTQMKYQDSYTMNWQFIHSTHFNSYQFRYKTKENWSRPMLVCRLLGNSYFTHFTTVIRAALYS